MFLVHLHFEFLTVSMKPLCLGAFVAKLFLQNEPNFRKTKNERKRSLHNN